MKGRKPKKPEGRQRRNKSATAATLKATPPVPEPQADDAAPRPQAIKRAPPMPSGTMWEKQVRAWWKDVWASPMAQEWLPSDRHVLHLIAELRNEFARHATASLAAEIRQQEARLGLSPMDRHRLQWRIEPDDRKPAAAPTAQEMRANGEDPRESLRAVP